jgi:hypothetical protein
VHADKSVQWRNNTRPKQCLEEKETGGRVILLFALVIKQSKRLCVIFEGLNFACIKVKEKKYCNRCTTDLTNRMANSVYKGEKKTAIGVGYY